jgi:hypothetical protein
MGHQQAPRGSMLPRLSLDSKLIGQNAQRPQTGLQISGTFLNTTLLRFPMVEYLERTMAQAEVAPQLYQQMVSTQ